MNRFRWPLLILAICLPLLVLVSRSALPGISRVELAMPAAVPDGDLEMAWFNTTTGGATWERFVAGVKAFSHPSVSVDDRGAFPAQTGAVPEVVIAHAGRSSTLRIRWYKLSGEDDARSWMTKLAARNPAPLAVIGGGSSDRARDLALALADQKSWHGGPPLFFITNASAEIVRIADYDNGPGQPAGTERKLLSLYEGRSFRVCFSNRQIAEAMLDFVWRTPSLRPQSPGGRPPKIFHVAWKDDPFSSDLLEQFKEILPTVLSRNQSDEKPHVITDEVPFSVGGYSQPNPVEQDVAARILSELRQSPEQRALIVLPTVPAPARRLLRAICERDPQAATQLVALNGDGMGANTILRDGEYLWPVPALPVPLLLFTHANPVDYSGSLQPPGSTDDILQTRELIRIIVGVVFEPETVSGPDALIQRLRSMEPRYFGTSGNRRGGTGEYLLLLRPTPQSDAVADAVVEVWMRRPDRSWHLSRTQPLQQSRKPRP